MKWTVQTFVTGHSLGGQFSHLPADQRVSLTLRVRPALNDFVDFSVLLSTFR